MKANYTVPYRRKREGRTDYKKRLSLLKSRKTRLVIRKTNTQILIQFTDYNPDGDQVKISLNSSSLKKEGWKGSFNNLPAAYLAGYKAGLLAKQKGIKEAVLDKGLQIHLKGSRIYACLKGVVDAGIKTPASPSIYPSEDRLKGKHISDDYEKKIEDVKKKIEGK